ncbi:MAG: DUF2147 domain-containing protein [Roseiarcus sp.]|jgi:uncharacterized protein (DUF2147 family)
MNRSRDGSPELSRRAIMSGLGVAALMAVDLLASNAEAAPAPDPRLGAWKRGDGEARVVLAFREGKLCATNTWIRDPASGEKVGDRLWFDVSPSAPKVWSGTAYDPQRNMTFSVTMTLTGDQLLTEGWILGGLISKTARWTRA